MGAVQGFANVDLWVVERNRGNQQLVLMRKLVLDASAESSSVSSTHLQAQQGSLARMHRALVLVLDYRRGKHESAVKRNPDDDRTIRLIRGKLEPTTTEGT